MRYEIHHITCYRYVSDISISHHIACLRPRESMQQQCLEFQLSVNPSASIISSHTDYFGNTKHFISVDSAHSDFSLSTTSTVEIAPNNIPPLDDSPAWELVRDELLDGTPSWVLECAEFTFNTSTIRRRKEFMGYAEESFTPGRPLLLAVEDLSSRIFRDFAFDPAATMVSTPVEDFFKSRRGVCQDFAQFAIACIRSMGLPARYVSGYLETIPPPGKPKLIGADASHAWISVFCPGVGWVDFDPTNGLLPKDRHVSIAWGRDYQEVCPVRGVILGSGGHTLSVSVDMNPV